MASTNKTGDKRIKTDSNEHKRSPQSNLAGFFIARNLPPSQTVLTCFMEYMGDDTMMKVAFSILFAIVAGIALWAGCISVMDVELMILFTAVGMTIDVQTETVVPFSDARSAFPGIDRRLSLATLHRWRLNGVRGVRLETCLIGGLRYTSLEAIARFIAAQNADDAPAAAVINASQRRKQSEAARAELEKMGVSGAVSRTTPLPTKDLIATTGVAKQ